MSDTQPVLRLSGLRKSYNVGEPTEVEVLHGIDLTIEREDFAALIGQSGSGKSTLLNLVGLLDSPTDGELFLLGQPTRQISDQARTALRGRDVGFVFQFHHLISAFTAMENVLMPLMVSSGRPTAEQIAMARQLLEDVGLEKHMDRKPSELSGGQQQRVAVARALITKPALVLADEPTGNLDSQTADEVFALFRRFNRKYGCAVLLVTHDPRLATRCDRVITLQDGQIISDERHPAPANDAEQAL
jgi:lipoprotein-releasing system ATP-binding protein